ncbi:MAG: ATP-dependent zinc metalloprotease FtsH [Spirochaetia bacterium]
MAEQPGNNKNKKKKNKDCWDKNCPDGGVEENPSLLRRFQKKPYRYTIIFILATILIVALVNSFIPGSGVRSIQIEFSLFKEKIKDGEIVRVEMAPDRYTGFTATAEEYQTAREEADRGFGFGGAAAGAAELPVRYTTTPVDDPGFISLLDENDVVYYAVQPQSSPFLGILLNWLFPLILLFAIWRFIFRRMGGGAGADVMSFGRNKSQIVAEGDTGVRFGDVAGADESKAELEEVVDFLQNPARYTDIGGKIPKGVLLVGAPGTGKTLLARAVAGEAGVPFFRMSGADFVEMFVGVGAARVRDLFRQARQKAPCIIFIDELDAIGKARGYGMGGNDEREQTLNQLLVEMDGFDARTGVILLAATNRPEILDPALLRPGRFDRQVLVDKPDLQGRVAILAIHTVGVKLNPNVDLEKVARATPGLVGADLANIVNEAALLAVRDGRKEVLQEDFSRAIEKVIAGLEKRNRLIHPKERKIVAFHETGHALVAHFTPGSDPVEKVSIVPRGLGALGYTLQLPSEERYLITQSELIARVDVLLAGRAAEEIVFDEISTGAANDLTKATDIIKKMITEYGMSKKFSNVYLPYKQGSPFLGDQQYTINREYSEATQQYIDEEIARLVSERYSAVKKLLTEKKLLLEQIADRLMEVETIEGEDFRKLAEAG